MIASSGQFLRCFEKQAMISYKIYNKREFKLMMWMLKIFRLKHKHVEYSCCFNMGVQMYRVHESNDCSILQIILMTFVKPIFKNHFNMFSCIYMYICDMLVEYKWSRINVSFGWVFDDRIWVVEVLYCMM